MAETVYNSSHTGEQIDAAVAWLLAHAQDHICGGAVSGTTISVPSNPTYWFAGAGTYTCGSDTITIPEGSIGIISYDGSTWSSTVFSVGITGIINDLITGGIDKALSASMGKVLKANIELVQSNLDVLKEALANIAFTGNKPEFSELDFGGEKVSITINNTLSGCTANKSGVQRVSAGSNLVVTLTADNGKLLRSVTASIGTVTIAQDKTTATVTISNVSADVTVNITASATAKGSFTASISDSRVSGTGASSGIVEGSAWSSQLSLNNTAEEGAAITSISASMEGGGEISVDGNTISTSFVTGNITITAVVRVVGRFNVTLPSDSRLDFSNGATSIPEGSSYSNTLSLNNTAAAGETINNLTATMEGGGTISVNGNTISTQNVTGNIVISCSVGRMPSLIHRYDMKIDTDANNKQYIADKKGSFPLYNSVDASLDTDTFGSGWYGNGSYSPNRNGGVVKYGNPVLGLSAGDDFSVVLKDLFVYPKSQNINPSLTIGYNIDQMSIKFHPEREVNRNLNSEVGQFELSVWRNAASGAIGNGDYVQLNIKKWTTNTSYFGSSGRFPCNREKIAGTDTYTHTYHLMMTFVASTLKATAYLIDIDNVNNTINVTNGGELTMEAPLKITAIGFKKMDELGGLDVYNYAVAENDIDDLFSE